jgi:hypothetical protein
MSDAASTTRPTNFRSSREGGGFLANAQLVSEGHEPALALRRRQITTPPTTPASASPRARAIHPQGVLVSEDAGSAATVSIGLVSALVVVGVSGVVVSPRAAASTSAIQPQNPSVGGSPSPVSVAPVLVVAGAVGVGVGAAVSVGMTVVAGCVTVSGSRVVVGASAVVVGEASVRVGSVRLGTEPVGNSVTPDNPGSPVEPSPLQPPRR